MLAGVWPIGPQIYRHYTRWYQTFIIEHFREVEWNKTSLLHSLVRFSFSVLSQGCEQGGRRQRDANCAKGHCKRTREYILCPFNVSTWSLEGKHQCGFQNEILLAPKIAGHCPHRSLLRVFAGTEATGDINPLYSLYTAPRKPQHVFPLRM